jgi:hypothetical protein
MREYGWREGCPRDVAHQHTHNHKTYNTGICSAKEAKEEERLPLWRGGLLFQGGGR